MLWYGAEAYLSLHLTWAEPEGEGQHGQQWRGGGRTVLSLVERDEDGTRQVAVVEVDGRAPLVLGVTVEGADARFWFVRDGVRASVGPELDFSRLSDDYGSRLRFTGAMAGIQVWDPVDAGFTADFSRFRLDCTAALSCSGFRKAGSAASGEFPGLPAVSTRTYRRKRFLDG